MFARERFGLKLDVFLQFNKVKITMDKNNIKKLPEQKGGSEWILCPVCSGKTRVKVRSDTVLANFPLYCPKCGKEKIISVKNKRIIQIREPDA